ncbi:hypothetical protein [Rhizobium sp. Root482]|uniref:hypothetical protein n=1 Tax=Rhizobium sp. Root482 TaxID=1736543 RepID=UPI0006F4806E|nr:hypothetical protein [Rhizobium sp. Root482]KQY20058.1 hypothetical protein ASD31_06705 [Rhizobium sp. Root482]
MKKENGDRFRELYLHWWSENLKSIPEGHVDLLAGLFHQCTLISTDNGDVDPWVSLHFERLEDEGGLFRATAAPTVDFERWTNGSAIALIIALQFFNERQQHICQVCGLLGGLHCPSPDVLQQTEGALRCRFRTSEHANDCP